MTPAARNSAAIEVLDQYLSGAPLEKALTNWARGARYAGSKDRAAVRDIAFQAVRCRDSYAAIGGQLSGRGLVIGHVMCDGTSRVTADGHERIAEMFDGGRFAPDPLSAHEKKHLEDTDFEEKTDLPDWLTERLVAQYGAKFIEICEAMKTRAPTFVRVNLSKTSRADAQDALAREDIAASPHPLADTALEITQNARGLSRSSVFADGLVELQDAASQAVIDEVETEPGMRVFDYCAGGGGKALALADRVGLTVHAHDVDPGRMRDIPVRAGRANVEISVLNSSELKRQSDYDIVLCDAPCSGSGAWRRAVDGKWAFTEEKLRNLTQIQAEILDDAKQYVRPKGLLVYATCSLLREENTAQIVAFQNRSPDFTMIKCRQFTPLEGGDGFFVAIMRNQ